MITRKPVAVASNVEQMRVELYSKAAMAKKMARYDEARHLYWIWCCAQSGDSIPWEQLTAPVQMAWLEIVEHYEPRECKECGGELFCAECAAKEARKAREKMLSKLARKPRNKID